MKSVRPVVLRDPAAEATQKAPTHTQRKETMKCAHVFIRRRGWWYKFWLPVWTRWVCQKCGITTRTYDTVDAWMTRPIHRHMSVAFPGYNTAKRKP